MISTVVLAVRLKDREGDINDLNKNMAKMSQAKTELDATLAKSVKAKTELDATLAKSVKAKTELDATLAKSVAGSARKDSEINTLENQMTAFVVRLKDREGDINNLDKKIDTMILAKIELDATLAESVKANTELDASLAKSVEGSAMKDAEINSLENEVTALNTEVETLTVTPCEGAKKMFASILGDLKNTDCSADADKFNSYCPALNLECPTTPQKICKCALKHNVCGKTCAALLGTNDQDQECNSYAINGVCGGEFPSNVSYAEHCPTIGEVCPFIPS